jgi:hypothetical protein
MAMIVEVVDTRIVVWAFPVLMNGSSMLPKMNGLNLVLVN